MKTILIVDDSVSVRQVASMTLSRAGHKVIEAVDGRDALEKLAANKVHLVLSDVNMPVMDGLTLAKEIKAHPQFRFTPVVMLTTEAGDDKKALGRAAGVKAWIVKPFQPQALLDAVAKLVLP